MTIPECGTYSGYQHHRRLKDAACGPCRAAAAAYARERRRTNAAARATGRLVMRAQRRALTRLADAHRDEYQRYYADALAELRSWETTAA